MGTNKAKQMLRPYSFPFAFIGVLKVIPEAYIWPVRNKIVFKEDGVYAGPEHKTAVYRLAAVANGHGTHNGTAMFGGIVEIGDAGGEITGAGAHFKVFPVFAQQVVEPYRHGEQ